MLSLILACSMCLTHAEPQHKALWSVLSPTVTISLEHHSTQSTQTLRSSTTQNTHALTPHTLSVQTTSTPRQRLRWSIMLGWDLTRAWRVIAGGQR